MQDSAKVTFMTNTKSRTHAFDWCQNQRLGISLNGIYALYSTKGVFWSSPRNFDPAWAVKNVAKALYFQRYKVHADIHEGFLANESGMVKNATFFCNFGRHFFGTFRVIRLQCSCLWQHVSSTYSPDSLYSPCNYCWSTTPSWLSTAIVAAHPNKTAPFLRARGTDGRFARHAQTLIGFPMTLKRMTLNDVEMPFYAKFCFVHRFDWVLIRGFRRQQRESE